MSQNRTSTDFTGTSQTGAQAGTGIETKTTSTQHEATQHEGSTIGSPGAGSSTGASSSGSAAGTATALAQEYGTKITEAASQAKEFVSDKMTVVGDKIKELQNADLAEITENAKDYARKNPGQAILISAAAGLLVGLILRGRR
jgi:ElaB/YqjD/DUF883 family membrane-anchored ribosome-binding protein